MLVEAYFEMVFFMSFCVFKVGKQSSKATLMTDTVSARPGVSLSR